MGRPEGVPSLSQPGHDMQPQEYQYGSVADEATHVVHDEFSAPAHETHYFMDQNQLQQPLPNDQQAQHQQLQPPQAQQQQPFAAPQYPPPQPNSQAFTPQPAQATQFPPQNSPVYPNGINQPATYPPQQNAVQFPPENGPIQAVNYPPNSMPVQPTPASYPPPQVGFQAPQAVPFPPQNGAPGGFVGIPPSPHKHQLPRQGIPAQGMPVPQPQHMQVAVGNNEPWATGLFDCMDDPMNALTTALFPCLTFGQIAEIVDSGSTSCGTSGMLYGAIAFCIALPCLMSCTYRTKLRNKFGLVEAPAPDWVAHFLFEPCALCQEYRELQRRGWDPTIGWQGNLARKAVQQQQVQMVPPTNQQMMG